VSQENPSVGNADTSPVGTPTNCATRSMELHLFRIPTAFATALGLAVALTIPLTPIGLFQWFESLLSSQ
jgi:hypothetical protein